ncbi:MAG TPA: glucokinase, partial [Campylobacterales bacterium]|nr:glucokinase [Campylobacterales bacterium]
MILAGDVGGTKVNLALFEIQGDDLTLVVKHQFKSADFSSLEHLILAFQEKVSFENITAVCLGIAGAVIEGECKATNLPWTISVKKLQKLFKIESVKLINDLEATAFGMLYLKDEAFVQLNPKAVASKGNRAVIAAGTGLGEGMLFYDGKHFHPIASEGGHTDFAPLNPQQDELLKWLRVHFPEHVSYERLVSGMGIHIIYKFLVEQNFAPEPQQMLTRSLHEDPSATISHCALRENDPLCLETLKLFCAIYGAEAGNLALKSMALGGVYIGGGIAAKILPLLQESNFMETFSAKGRFREMLETLEVKVALNPETALLGAAHYAKE